MESNFGLKIRELREAQNLYLRQIAPMLEMDTAQLSKIEKGVRQLKKEQLSILAKILKTDKSELETLWLADQIVDVVRDNQNALDAMQVAEESVKYLIKQGKKK
jgi:HTH-type transcriptional regulator, competence development regulator